MEQIPVFFTPAMVAEVESLSPSAGKPVKAVRSWQGLGLPLSFQTPAPVSISQFSLAHDQSFVEAVLDCSEDNGFGERSRSVADSLPYTSGAMLAAALCAIENGQVAVAPCSGFHHAGWNFSGGYCTFNGLMVTACVLKDSEVVKRVGILDFDQHWGNGTQNIIGKLNAKDWMTHYSSTSYFGTTESSEDFLEAIPEVLSRFKGCDVVLYQAGADPHIDDPLGGWLTTKQLHRRDLAVFRVLKEMGIPVAWNLAGGYQRPLRKVLEIHDNTMRACHAVYGELTRTNLIAAGQTGNTIAATNGKGI